MAPVVRSTLRIGVSIATGAAFDRRARLRDQLVVENLVEAVVLAGAVADGVARRPRLVEQLGEVEALAPSNASIASSLVEHLHLPDHFVERR